MTTHLAAANVALLAPVPLQHLISGRDVCVSEGCVAFGSRAWEVFRELDTRRRGAAVDVFIYASHGDRGGPLEVSWHGRYVGHVESVGGAHPAGMRFRPPSTAQYVKDSLGKWAVFWEVEGLQELLPTQRIATAHFTGFQKKRPYGEPFVPEGPLLIEHP